MPIELGYDTIAILDMAENTSNIIETVKSSRGEMRFDVVASVSPEFTEERMYPPTRNLTSASHTISGEAYGNGVYITDQSTFYGNVNNYKAFSAFNTVLKPTIGADNQYSSIGIYEQNNYIVNDFLGDWVKIKLPVRIKLTKYGIKQRPGESIQANYSPGKYKIYASNDNNSWDELVYKSTKITYNSQIEQSNDYFEENVNTDTTYQYFVLVVNELFGNADHLKFDEWYIYGKEKLVEPQPIYETQTTITEYTVLDADATNLIAHYKFDDGSDVGKDTQGNFDLTNSSVSTVNDFLELSADFVSSNSSFLYRNNANITWVNWVQNEGFSISFWFKINNTTNNNTFLWVQQHGDSQKFYIRRVGTTNVIEFIGKNYTGDTKISMNSGTINNFENNWHHLVLQVKSNEGGKMFINNNLVSTTSSSTINVSDTNNYIYLGKDSTITHDGQIDDFRIYNKVLTPTEIGYLANNMIVNPEYKLLTFKNDDLVYDFTPYNDLASWQAYATSIGATTQLTNYDHNGVFGNLSIASGYGSITLTMLLDYDTISVVFGNSYTGDPVILYVDDVEKSRCNAGESKTYTQTYTGTPVLKIIEGLHAVIDADLIITFSKTQTPYTLTFDNPTECDILIVGSTNAIEYNGIELSGTISINVGSSSSVSTYTTSSGSKPITSSISGTSISYNDTIVIIRYKQEYIQPPFDAQWTYSATDTSVHHYGNVGIGTAASDTTQLTIRGDTNITGNYYKNNIILCDNPWYEKDNKDIYTISNNVGIGVLDPQYKLHVRGTVYANNGGFSGNGSTSWSTPSDRRIKENVVEASNEVCFENVKNINLYKFNYVAKYSKTTKRTQFGFVAQEVQKYYPKAVQEKEIQVKDNLTINNLLTVDVTQLNYTLYGAIKHYVNEIDKIKSQLGIVDVVEEEPVTETTEEAVTEDAEEPVTNIDIV